MSSLLPLVFSAHMNDQDTDEVFRIANGIAALEAEVERLHWQLETLIDDTFNRTCFAGWSRLSIGADLDRRWKERA